jgi:hypothetical protein
MRNFNSNLGARATCGSISAATTNNRKSGSQPSISEGLVSGDLVLEAAGPVGGASSSTRSPVELWYRWKNYSDERTPTRAFNTAAKDIEHTACEILACGDAGPE